MSARNHNWRNKFDPVALQRWHDRALAHQKRIDELPKPFSVHAAIVRLSPWTNHHNTCARVTSASECDCGLQAALLEFEAIDQAWAAYAASQPPEYIA